MAHLVETMAFVRETPWHGLGNRLPEKQPLDVWLQAAGMDWTIENTEALYSTGVGSDRRIQVNPDARVLYRSDSGNPLSVVSNRYHIRWCSPGRSWSSTGIWWRWVVLPWKLPGY